MRREGSDQPELGRTPEEVADAKRAELQGVRDLEKARQARVAKAVVAIGIAAILLIFIVSNSQGVKVHYVFFTRNPPLIWVMFACALLGGVLGYLVGRPGKQIRIRRGHKEERKK
jgi:uncharacterized integral membrane protein